MKKVNIINFRDDEALLFIDDRAIVFLHQIDVFDLEFICINMGGEVKIEFVVSLSEFLYNHPDRTEVEYWAALDDAYNASTYDNINRDIIAK